MKGKIRCQVEGCDRGMFMETARRKYGHVHVFLICGRHWRRLTKTERAVAHRIARIEKRFGREATGDRWRAVWKTLARRAGDPSRIGRESGL